MGYPVYLTAQMPTATAAATVCALFGSFSKAVVLGDRAGIRVARSDDYKFLDDKITLKASSRYDFNVYDPGDSTDAGAVRRAEDCRVTTDRVAGVEPGRGVHGCGPAFLV